MRVEPETRVVWSVKKIVPTLSRVLLNAACLKDGRQILDWTTQKASALDVRLQIVIVISVKTKLGNFEEHCSGGHVYFKTEIEKY